MIRDSVHVVEISGAAGLQAAQDIAGSLHQAVAGHDTVTITTAAITSADITTIQLLLAARKQALASGKSLSLSAPPIGVLHELLIATGCLDADGRPQSPEGDFWISLTAQGKGKAA